MLSLLFSILQSQVKKFLSCVSPCAAKTLSIFGRVRRIRTADLYHVKIAGVLANYDINQKIMNEGWVFIGCKTHLLAPLTKESDRRS